jgi:hypothetical protein
MSDEIRVTLLRLTPEDYGSFTGVEGRPLTELFPIQMYVVLAGDQILEIAAEFTDRMREAGFNEGVFTGGINQS